MKKIILAAIERITDFLFIRFRARRAAKQLRARLPFLGMVEKEKLVLAAQTRTSGLVYLSGFTIPRFEYELFVPTKDGWEPRKMSVLVTKHGGLEWETDEGLQTLPYRNQLAKPIVQVLKSVAPAFPFTHFNVSTPEQLDARRPQLKG